MKKDNSIIIGSGVIGSYLAKFLLSKKQRIIVTSRKRKKSYTNYNKLDIVAVIKKYIHSCNTLDEK